VEVHSELEGKAKPGEGQEERGKGKRKDRGYEGAKVAETSL